MPKWPEFISSIAAFLLTGWFLVGFITWPNRLIRLLAGLTLGIFLFNIVWAVVS